MIMSRRDGAYLLALGIAVFVLFGFILRFVAKDSMGDFKMVYYGASCLLHHCDPYSENELRNFYRTELGEPSNGGAQHLKAETVYVNVPPMFLLMVPFAILPEALAAELWMVATAATLIMAGILIWNLGAEYAPRIAGGLTGLLLANAAIVLANGNPAGIVIGLCAIAIWCFAKERAVWVGIPCLAVSLAAKPHDAGLVWLYFLLAGGVYRKRALQTLAATAVLCLAVVMCVGHAVPNWMPEVRANLTEISVRGGNNDPGPAGATSKSRTPEVITDLQAAVSVFLDDPAIYNPVAYAVGGVLLLAWSIVTVRSRRSLALTWIALAAVVPITMLVTYHRAYDAKLLLLTVPACALLWAEGGPTARVALLVTTAGVVFTGEIPLALLFSMTRNLHAVSAGLPGEMQTLLLARQAPLALLLVSVFYLWVYVRRAFSAESGS